MIREAAPLQMLQGTPRYVCREPMEVADGGQGVRNGDRDRHRYGYRDARNIQMPGGGVVNPYIIKGRLPGVVRDMSGVDIYTKGRRRLLCNWTCVSASKYSGSDTKMPPQSGHHPPWCDTWVPVRL